MRRPDPAPPLAAELSADAVVRAGLEAIETGLAQLNDVHFDRLDAHTLAALAQRLRTATSRIEGLQARTVTAADSSGAARDAGAADGARWLSKVTGATPGSARRAATLGEAMDTVPELARAVSSGAVDQEQAATLAAATRRGSLTPDAVGELVDEARYLPAGALSKETRRREGRADQQRLRRDEQAARDMRRFTMRDIGEGMVDGSFRLPTVEAAVVRAAVRAVSHPDPADTPDDRRRTPEQRRADALVDVARAALEVGAAGTVRSVKPHVSVIVPITMLAATEEEAEAAGAIGTLDDGTVLSARTARKILCDATVRRIVLDPAGRPLDVGRATRTWSGAQRAASRAVDGGCRGPACDRPFDWTQLHHVTWWRHGGRTSIDDGVPLCDRCHDLVHHDGWDLQFDPGDRTCTWTAPDGTITTTGPYGPAAPSPAPPRASTPAAVAVAAPADEAWAAQLSLTGRP